jgi:hypothetical protein
MVRETLRAPGQPLDGATRPLIETASAAASEMYRAAILSRAILPYKV